MKAEVWVPRALDLVRAIVVLFVAWLLTRVSRRLLRRVRLYTIRVMERHGGSSTSDLDKRAATIISVLAKLISTMIWLVALVMAATELGFKPEPLLAGLGIAGLALGLGAQALIKDWLAGLFILLEDQIRIGDSVTINGTSGSVEEINLRTTVLRSENGAVHIIPNGLIATLANLTREYAYYVFEATLAHRTDVDRALKILAETGAEIAADGQYREVILAPMEVMGVDRLSEKGVVIRARIKTLPSKQALVGRELNRRVTARLAAADIAFPPISS